MKQSTVLLALTINLLLSCPSAISAEDSAASKSAGGKSGGMKMDNRPGMDMGGMKMDNMPGMDMGGMKMDNMPGTDMGGMKMDNMPGMDMGGMKMDNMPGMDMGSSESKAPQAPAPVQGETIRLNAKYDLPQLKRLAESNNPTIIQARAQIRGERGKAQQAGLWPNPAFQYAGELVGERQAGAGEFQGGGIQQEIVLGGKLKYSRKKYQARMSAAEQQAKAQQMRVMNDVEILFYTVLALEEKLKLQEELLRSARDWQLTKREMFNLGQANEADLQLANIVLEKQKLEVQTARNNVQSEWVQLITVVGIDEDYSPLNGNLYEDKQPIDRTQTLARLLEQSPELAQAKDKLKADEITLQRERRQPIPNLVLCGQAGYDQMNNSFASNVMVNLTNVPIFNRNQGTIEQARADLDRQRAQVKLTQLQLTRRFAEEYMHYLTALQHVQAYKESIVPASKRRYELNLKSYADTRIEWPDVLETQRDYFSARLAYIHYLLEWRASSVELEGMLLTGGLVPPPGVTPPGHIDATPQPR
jgi:Outer membrane protein